MKERPTPETDGAERMAFAQEYMVPTDFARKLERERDEWYYKAHANFSFTIEARAERDKARAELLAMARKALEGWE